MYASFFFLHELFYTRLQLEENCSKVGTFDTLRSSFHTPTRA